ncbi:aminotransferase-like domain-containing protein, partial [Klebsiella pneumoniae]
MNDYVPDLIAESAGVSRVQQVFQSFMSAFKEQKIRPGDKLPSVRVCAQAFKISPSTIVAAFDRLKEEGIIESQRGSGFYLAENFLSGSSDLSGRERGQHRKKNIELPIDDSWLLANVYRADNTNFHSIGCGWLPDEWYAQPELAKALRDTSRNEKIVDYGYGNPYGNSELRIYLAHMLADRTMNIQCDNILLTSGASRALDLIASAFLNTDDTVLVDEPGYCNFLSSMLGKRIKLVGVKWTAEGPDMRQMERILEKENINFYFTNPWIHNPTGASISLNTAHRLLTLAERYQF